jgi:hypothetical protein
MCRDKTCYDGRKINREIGRGLETQNKIMEKAFEGK